MRINEDSAQRPHRCVAACSQNFFHHTAIQNEDVAVPVQRNRARQVEAVAQCPDTASCCAAERNLFHLAVEGIAHEKIAATIDCDSSRGIKPAVHGNHTSGRGAALRDLVQTAVIGGDKEIAVAIHCNAERKRNTNAQLILRRRQEACLRPQAVAVDIGTCDGVPRAICQSCRPVAHACELRREGHVYRTGSASVVACALRAGACAGDRKVQS